MYNISKWNPPSRISTLLQSKCWLSAEIISQAFKYNGCSIEIKHICCFKILQFLTTEWITVNNYLVEHQQMVSKIWCHIMSFCYSSLHEVIAPRYINMLNKLCIHKFQNFPTKFQVNSVFMTWLIHNFKRTTQMSNKRFLKLLFSEWI